MCCGEERALSMTPTNIVVLRSMKYRAVNLLALSSLVLHMP